MERLLDTGDELVCPGCGIAKEKQVMEPSRGRTPRPRDAIRQFLGSYMGPPSAQARDRSARSITGTDAGYR